MLDLEGKVVLTPLTVVLCHTSGGVGVPGVDSEVSLPPGLTTLQWVLESQTRVALVPRFTD